MKIQRKDGMTSRDVAKAIYDQIDDTEEFCTLCYEPLGNGKSHGSSCK